MKDMYLKKIDENIIITFQIVVSLVIAKIDYMYGYQWLFDNPTVYNTFQNIMITIVLYYLIASIIKFNKLNKLKGD